MIKKLGPWIVPVPSEFIDANTTARVRYPNPLDGRTWDLDNTPRWIAMVASCCGPNEFEPNRPFHYDWSVDCSDGKKRDVKEDTIRTSFADAQAAADAYMQSLGWELDK